MDLFMVGFRRADLIFMLEILESSEDRASDSLLASAVPNLETNYITFIFIYLGILLEILQPK